MNSRRPATRKTAQHGAEHRVAHSWTRWAFFLLCVFVALGMAVPAAWARPHSAPARQTVPMTPPPTWTPSGPSGPTAEPTRPKPATSEPTAENETPSPTGEPTKPPEAKPWLGLSAEPLLAQPGTPVSVLLELQNLGDGPMENATIVLSLHPALSLQGVKASLGQAQPGSDEVVWTPGPLGGHGGGALQLAVVVVPDALPGTSILMRATLTWPGGQVQSNEWPLTLPEALLPEVGG